MNPQDPLAALHALREPALIGWWPLAPGWWALIILLLLALSLLAWYCFKRYRGNAYRRMALRQLQDICDSFQSGSIENKTQAKLLGNTNALLKSVALRTFPQRDIASLSGETWVAFLNDTRGNTSSTTTFPPAFTDAVYQRDIPAIDVQLLFSTSQSWIKRHRGSP